MHGRRSDLENQRRVRRDVVGVARFAVPKLRSKCQRHLIPDAELRQRRLPASHHFPLAERELEGVAAVIFIELRLLACVDIDR